MLPVPYPERVFLRAGGIYSDKRIQIPNTQNMILSIFSSESIAICRIMIKDFRVPRQVGAVRRHSNPDYFFLYKEIRLEEQLFFFLKSNLCVFSSSVS